MYNVHLTHSLLCFEFVELTLIYQMKKGFIAYKKVMASAALALLMPHGASAGHDIAAGDWQVVFDEAAHTVTYVRAGQQLVRGAYVEVHDASGNVLLSKDYPKVALSKTQVADEFGAGAKYTYTYSGLEGKDNIEHSVYVYPGLNYVLVEAVLVAAGNSATTNYIAPIVTTTSVAFLPADGQNVVYDMPHDNDNWVGYSAQPWSMGVQNTSCEVSAFYDVASRRGLVVGSIEHDNWKSGITATPAGRNRLRNLTVAAGVVGVRTNDVWEGRPSLARHGCITGKRVRSPRFFLGFYDDWRNGLEALGEATERLCPKLPWSGGTVFAWQSWGGMAEHVNYEGAVNVSDFFSGQLEPAGFCNENGVCYMVLDSFWDNFTDEQLDRFVEHCRANGQIPGIYHTPFSYWGSEADAEAYRPYDGSPWTWADISLRANGQLRRIASIALDPTHPGTIEYNRQRFAKFKKHGFKYIKLDFINNGTLEADSYYDKAVTTGMQAYTYGMDRIIQMADGMFIDLSIAPVFPAKGHTRRISCDSWGELDNSMYSLNSIELGWWLDRVYQYNDPDHLVLSRAATDGEARIRYTCGAITGTVLLGDNYSLAGSYLGKQAERDLAMRIATNADINAVARLGRSFRPIEGGMTEARFSRYGKYNYSVDREFALDTEDALYYVVFNYDREAGFGKRARFDRLGLSAKDVKCIRELWTGSAVDMSADGFMVSVPAADVCVYKLEKSKDYSAMQRGAGFTVDNVNVSYSSGSLLVEAPGAVASVSVYDAEGALRGEGRFGQGVGRVVLAQSLGRGVYVAKVCLASGGAVASKFYVGL